MHLAKCMGLWLALCLALWTPAAHAAITEVVWGTFATSPSGTVSTISVPTKGIGATLATGDIGIVQITLRTTAGITPPAGWSLLADRSEGGTLRTLVYLRLITNPVTEPPWHSWSFPATRVTAAGILIRGVDNANPVNASAVWSDATPGYAITLPAITTTTAGALQMGFASVANAAATFTTPTGMVKRVDSYSNAAGSGASHAMLTQTESAAGALGSARTTTATLPGARIGILLALNPAPPAPTLHHIEIRHGSGQGLTCQPSTLTIAACANAACTSYYDGGVSGVLTASGAGMTVNWPDGSSFDIAAGGHTVNRRIQQTTAGTTTLGVQYANPAATCTFGSPSCTWTAINSGFVFDVPDHVAGTAQTVQITAVTPGGGNACAGSFASATRNLVFKCTPREPASGTTRAVSVAGTALNAAGNAQAACDGAGRTLGVAFDASGQASVAVVYGDVGRMALSATYTGSAATGDSGLTITGSDTFIAAPASFQVTPDAGPIKAGNTFSATVTALTSSGAVAPSFGREDNAETVTLSFARTQPTGSGAIDGVFSGTPVLSGFAAGAASASDLAWTEVGRASLTATLTNPSYLDSGFTASGSAAVGDFIPHHVDVTATAACGSFSYAGQPFAATLTARNAGGGITRNFDGSGATTPSFAQAFGLAEATALGAGSLSGASVAAADFTAGVAAATPSYAFTVKATAPQSLSLRASNGASGSAAISSAGYAEPVMALRSGRLRLSNAFGSASAALQLPLTLEYWNGQAWVVNSADACTSLGTGAVALSNPRDARGNASAAITAASSLSLSAGRGLLTLAAPAPAGSTLTVDIALNLGSSSADVACQGTHPATTGAGLPWLRSQNGACAATADRDPAGRASFGIHSPENRKLVHVRDLY